MLTFRVTVAQTRDPLNRTRWVFALLDGQVRLVAWLPESRPTSRSRTWQRGDDWWGTQAAGFDPRDAKREGPPPAPRRVVQQALMEIRKQVIVDPSMAIE